MWICRGPQQIHTVSLNRPVEFEHAVYTFCSDRVRDRARDAEQSRIVQRVQPLHHALHPRTDRQPVQPQGANVRRRRSRQKSNLLLVVRLRLLVVVGGAERGSSGAAGRTPTEGGALRHRRTKPRTLRDRLEEGPAKQPQRRSAIPQCVLDYRPHIIIIIFQWRNNRACKACSARGTSAAGGPKFARRCFLSFFGEEWALLEFLHAGPLQPCYATVIFVYLCNDRTHARTRKMCVKMCVKIA